MAKKILKDHNCESEGCYYEFDTETDLLGEGGMGRVFLGRRVESNGSSTRVAIKAMFEGLPDQVIERARREASIRILNDSLVRMYGFIESVEKDETGKDVLHCYVISEYLDGISLDNIVNGKLAGRSGEVNPEIEAFYQEYMSDIEGVSTKIIKSVLSGVMALHDAGYIHRDIDPSNIMVTTDGRIKLIDFGVAKQLVRLSTVDKELTATGQFIGKAGYAAPELVLGDIRSQNYSTDVYAIGILYFYLLTGHLPFEGSSYDMVNAHLKKKVPLGEVRSRQIKSVIRKATDKDQANRFVSAAQMRAAIDCFRFPERWYQDKVTLLSLFIALLMVGGLAWYLFDRMRPAEGSAQSRFESALTLLDDGDSAKAAAGLDSMAMLASEGYMPAKYELARTCLKFPKDAVSASRKKSLGRNVDRLGNLDDRALDSIAIESLGEYVGTDGHADFKALIVLGSIYLNGELVKADFQKARALFETGLGQAAKENNEEYVGQFEKALKIVDARSSESDKNK